MSTLNWILAGAQFVGLLWSAVRMVDDWRWMVNYRREMAALQERWLVSMRDRMRGDAKLLRLVREDENNPGRMHS